MPVEKFSTTTSTTLTSSYTSSSASGVARFSVTLCLLVASRFVWPEVLGDLMPRAYGGLPLDRSRCRVSISMISAPIQPISCAA